MKLIVFDITPQQQVYSTYAIAVKNR